MLPRIPPITRALLIANAVMFLLQLALGRNAMLPLELWPVGSGMVQSGGFLPWQLLTSGFMHGDFGHLFFNMLALWMFGAPLEQTWGEKRFLTYYLVCLIGGSLCQLALMTWLLSQQGQLSTSVGASGAIFGLLLGYGMLFPKRRMVLFPVPIEMNARTFVILFGVAELVFAYTGWQPGIGHFAHLGGMLFGWLLIRYWRGQPPFGKRRPPGPRIVR
jgi:membrane associated rhomboid family serine protease